MKTIFLLRHADAKNDFMIDDVDRPLTNRGLVQASAVGEYLNIGHHSIDCVLCSYARRTQMTLNVMKKSGLSVGSENIINNLYNASADHLMDVIRSSDDQYQSLLIIAHNPGIHQLVCRLCDNNIEKQYDHIQYSYSPASLSMFSCPINQWNQLANGQNHLINVFVPSE